MAGELRFRLFDFDRYQQVLPYLDELASTRRLGDAAVATVKLALARAEGLREYHVTGVDALARVVRNRDLDPRIFLLPASLNDAITAFVELLCFEEMGKWSLVEPVGPSWVVLESSLRALYDLSWFEDFVHGLSPGSVELAYPRGEVTSFALTRAALDELMAGSTTTTGRPDLDRHARQEVEGLIALVARAQSEKGWSLQYSTLL